MTIRSDKGYVSGQPRIEGHRIWVSHVIANVFESGLEEYRKDFGLEEQQIREAIDYCRGQNCVGNSVSYCQGCSKNSRHSGEDVWKVAEELHKKLSNENSEPNKQF